MQADGCTPIQGLTQVRAGKGVVNKERHTGLVGQFGDRLDVVLTPSAVGEAPLGPSETTGDAVMNSMWTLLHVPCINIPGASGPNGLPVGVTLVGPRLGDARLLAAATAVAPVLDGALR